MLQNIDQALYAKFKQEGYRIKKYASLPVSSIPEVVQLAYLDVNRTIRGIEPEQSLSFKQAAATFIETLLAGSPLNQTEFDHLHHQCCQKCLTFSSTIGARIHYGQAQKLLNMSLKYLYNEYAAYKGKLNQLRFPDNNIEHLFHLPIDSQIRNALINNFRFIAPTRLPWSQWTYEHYISFQHQLRQRMSPQYRSLEIDYMLWNTTALSVVNAFPVK
jgi:hypothetical protein